MDRDQVHLPASNPSLRRGGEQSDIEKNQSTGDQAHHLQSVEAPESGELSLGPSQPPVPPTLRGSLKVQSVVPH